MTQPDWKPLTLVTNTVRAKPDGLWTLVHEYMEGPVKLKLTASGQWYFAPGRSCGPDGLRDVGYGDTLLLGSAPLGALIAKVGGSSAEKPDAGKQVIFAVGQTCVIQLDDKAKGPLFLSMNDSPLRFGGHSKDLKIEAWEWR